MNTGGTNPEEGPGRGSSPGPAADSLEMRILLEAPNHLFLEVRGFPPTWFPETFAEDLRPLDVWGIPPADGEVLKRIAADQLPSRLESWKGPDRFSWAGLRGLPPEPAPELLEIVRTDLEDLTVSIPEEVFLFQGREDLVRVVFTWREHLDRALGTLLHRHVSSLAGKVLTPPNRRLVDELIRRADEGGFRSSGRNDFLDKGRTLEVRLHPLRPGPEPGPPGDSWILYYDATTGLWALSG